MRSEDGSNTNCTSVEIFCLGHGGDIDVVLGVDGIETAT